MIKGFADKETQKLFEGERQKAVPAQVRERAESKLAVLDAAIELEELRVPPGNRLEKSKGDREGQCSIRINQQYRICFRFQDGDAYEVEITDYH